MFLFLLLALFGPNDASLPPAPPPPRSTTLFDAGWKFVKDDPAGAEQVNFNDAAWRTLDLPHDWGIEGSYDRTNLTGRGGGYVQAGIGWYRKSFELKEGDAQQKVFIEFDGVMMNSDVWINGWHLGKRPYGYSSFQYDMTGHLRFGKGKRNVIAVRADNSVQPASRWYTGSGIYRHTRLVITNQVHVDHWGVFVSTEQITNAGALINIQTTIVDESRTKVNPVIETIILSPEGKGIDTIKSDRSRDTASVNTWKLRINIDAPELWDLDHPRLYTVVTRLRSGKTLLDEYKTSFGIRDIRFDTATGFLLNGTNIKIKGVCLHHDGGAVGAAVPLGIWERRLNALKAVGANAIRTSHNPVAPEFLDLCDRMGFLVLDENFDTWNAKKSNAENGYNLYFNDWWEKDTRDMVLRDRNHPSVILYSVGNEIHDNLNDASGFHKYKMQQDLIHSLDPTRNVTMALFRPALSHVYENGLADSMDVVGQNYRENELVAAHLSHPSRKVIGTENGHALTAWLALRDNPFMAGQFLWTGFDYLGEADWPALVNGQGLYDRTGGTRNVTFQRQSWWSDQPMVYTMRKEQNAGEGAWVSDWTPTDIDTYDDARIQVFSNCDEVELFLNGKSHGTKPRPADNASPRTWQLTFEKGTLKAVARNHGQVVATQELKTAGAPAKILLTSDKISISPSWDDLSYVRATIVDENGTPCPTADNQITFHVSGPGFLAGTDNADLASTESFLSPKRFAWKGTCIALIKANALAGSITITASADHLQQGSAVITAQPLAKELVADVQPAPAAQVPPAAHTAPSPDYTLDHLLFKDNFTQPLNAADWIIERKPRPGDTVFAKGGKLRLDTNGGVTVWLNRHLSGNLLIEYKRKVPVGSGPNDRLSDLNQFWMATDPRATTPHVAAQAANPNSATAPTGNAASPFNRDGVLESYDSLRLYYVGMGGNTNKTTRFRKYQGTGERSLLQEYTDQPHLLQADKEYDIRIMVKNGETKFWVDNNLFFDYKDPQPLKEGYFGFRSTKSRQEIGDFNVYSIK